jgi:phage terminase small subunit
MARRRPKRQTASNARRSPPRAGLWDQFRPPTGLGDAAEKEFHRLVPDLTQAGTLDRCDPAIVLEAARVRALLDQAHAELEGSPLAIKSGNGTDIKNQNV